MHSVKCLNGTFSADLWVLSDCELHTQCQEKLQPKLSMCAGNEGVKIKKPSGRNCTGDCIESRQRWRFEITRHALLPAFSEKPR